MIIRAHACLFRVKRFLEVTLRVKLVKLDGWCLRSARNVASCAVFFNTICALLLIYYTILSVCLRTFAVSSRNVRVRLATHVFLRLQEVCHVCSTLGALMMRATALLCFEHARFDLL